jgi:subtilase family serine protease
MAPNAKIILVEAASNSFADLFAAVDVASNLVAAGGGGEVSMSWGGSEFSTEASNDSHFTTAGLVYFASIGGTGGATIYPGVSPSVVSAGGTTINRNNSGTFTSETGWSGGGGPSKYEPRPSYQNAIATIVGSQRGAPDFSFDADPNSGVSVYDSTRCQGQSGWLVFGARASPHPRWPGSSTWPGTSLRRATLSSRPSTGIWETAVISGTSFPAPQVASPARWDGTS